MASTSMRRLQKVNAPGDFEKVISFDENPIPVFKLKLKRLSIFFFFNLES